jgi:hypothetical protein
MDLKDNKITIGEILKNPKAKAILIRNFPVLNNGFLLRMSHSMSLENTFKLATGHCDQDQIQKVIFSLNAI